MTLFQLYSTVNWRLLSTRLQALRYTLLTRNSLFLFRRFFGTDGRNKSALHQFSRA